MSEAISNLQKEKTGHRDWTQGPILRNLVLLSWPMIVMEAGYMISQILDMVWVGRTGPASIAAIGISTVVIALFSVVDMALIGGSRAMISRFIGAGDSAGARKVAIQAYFLAVAWAVLVTTTGLIFTEPILNLFGVAPDVVSEGVKYMRILFAGWISLEILVIGLYVIQSAGDSFKPMIIELSIRAVHAIISPLLVLGIGAFPQMGITGAAVANVVAQVLGAVAGLSLLFGGHTRLKLYLSDIRFVPNIAWRLIKIGLPNMFSLLLTTFSMFIITRLIVPFGTFALAANNIVSNIHSFIITPNLGFTGGIGVMAGQNLGARRPERAVRTAWLGAAVLEGFLIVCSVILLIWAPQFIGLFSEDPAVIEVGANFLRISTVLYLVIGLNSALQSCIGGAGDTLPNMIITICMIWAIQIPLTWFLSNYTGLGVNGIRWALVISSFAGAIAFFTYFRTGRWKRKKV